MIKAAVVIEEKDDWVPHKWTPIARGEYGTWKETDDAVVTIEMAHRMRHDGLILMAQRRMPQIFPNRLPAMELLIKRAGLKS